MKRTGKREAVLLITADVTTALRLPNDVPVEEGLRLSAEVERIVEEEIAIAKARTQKRFEELVQTSKWTGSVGDQMPPISSQAAPSAGRRSSE
jgi:hypothetical protein